METIRNLQDLLIEQLRELYNAEKQQINALPRFQELATSRDLKDAIKMHIAKTEDHVEILKEVFFSLEVTWSGEVSQTMLRMISEVYQLVDRSADSQVTDAAIIAGLQYIEHYEISGYGSVCAYANELDLENVSKQLYSILEDEKNADEQLTLIATEKEVNEKAKVTILTN